MSSAADAREDPVLFRFFNEIGIIEQLARAAFERALPEGLKISQFAVLNHLVRLGDDRSPAELAQAFQVTRGAMTNTLQRLEARDLISVGPDPKDGRGKRIALTALGRAMRERCVAATEPLFGDLRGQFGDEAFAAVLPFLAGVRDNLDSARDRPERPKNDKGARA